MTFLFYLEGGHDKTDNLDSQYVGWLAVVAFPFIWFVFMTMMILCVFVGLFVECNAIGIVKIR